MDSALIGVGVGVDDAFARYRFRARSDEIFPSCAGNLRDFSGLGGIAPKAPFRGNDGIIISLDFKEWLCQKDIIICEGIFNPKISVMTGERKLFFYL